MEIYIVFGAVVLVIGLWNLAIAVLGCFPQFRATAVGTLTKTNTRRNFRSNRGRFIPIMTRYTYTYSVNGKEYRYSSEKFHSKRRLLPKVSMVYVKWFPRRAYPNKFLGTTEWVLGIIMLFFGVMILFSLTA